MIDIHLQHETSVSTNSYSTCESKGEQKQRTYGNSTFYQNIYNDVEDAATPTKDMMNEDVPESMAPLDRIERLNDPKVLTKMENFRNANIERGSLSLCCCCHSQKESDVAKYFSEDTDCFTSGYKVYVNHPPAPDVLIKSEEPTVVTTKYVCNYTPTEIQEERKISKFHHFLERRQNKKYGHDTRLKVETSQPEDSDQNDDFEQKRHKKPSRKKDILRRFKKRVPEKNSFLKPPISTSSNQERHGAEASEVSNLTVLSMDNVEIIETEYPEITNFPVGSEVSSFLSNPYRS